MYISLPDAKLRGCRPTQQKVQCGFAVRKTSVKRMSYITHFPV